MTFDGAKLALIRQGELLVMLRDDVPHIPWPGHWDFPGGGREGDETPLAGALRELHEELGLELSPARVVWQLETLNTVGTPTWFFVAVVDDLDLSLVRFGDEGQEWRCMALDDFLAHPKAIPSQRERLEVWLRIHDPDRAHPARV